MNVSAGLPFTMLFGSSLTEAVNYQLDEELLPALKRGDERSVKYIYHRYWPMATKLVKTNGGKEEEAKDVFQESMLDFLEKIWSGGFVLTCKLSTYFYSVFRNKWLAHLRGSRSFVDIEEYVSVDALFEEATHDVPERPNDEQIMDAILSLGEPCKGLLIGFYYEGLSMEQLAARFGYKDFKVAKQQKFRCKDRLTQSLKKFFQPR